MPPVYLDCAATTPLDPAVGTVVRRYMEEDFGNAGSRTHEYGNRAKRAVQQARDQIAAVVSANRDDVILTSGATEANNLAILGLQKYGEATGRRHLICSAVEHKAVLEPFEELGRRGFSVTILPVLPSGQVDLEALSAALRPETLLVSVMHVNNETGIVQPIADVADALKAHDTYLHVDGAQGYGKELQGLRHPRIDLLSVSAHKIYGPKGVGALITRRRRFERPPLSPLIFGGGQERGLRPGTLPVALVAGFGEAAERSVADHSKRLRRVRELAASASTALAELNIETNGDDVVRLPHFLNFSAPGVDSEALILALKDSIAISNGSACTSTSYTGSYVLRAMGLSEEKVMGSVRMSWCHLTPDVPWKQVADSISSLVPVS